MQDYHKELIVIVLLYAIWALAILGLLWIVAGCTYVTVTPPSHETAEGHTNVMTMPSVSTCILAACDIVSSDRATRTGEGIEANNAASNMQTDQKADAQADVKVTP
jgi:hypothetical protein